jgi:hypothetical protein
MKNRAAVELSRRAGKAKNAKLTADERKESRQARRSTRRKNQLRNAAETPHSQKALHVSRMQNY